MISLSGFADLGRNEDARRFFEKSIRLAEATPDAEVPFTAHLGKAKILIALNQKAEGKAMLDRLLQEACNRGMQVREARLRIVLGEFAEKNGDWTEAITYFERAAVIATAQHLHRLIASASSHLAKLSEQNPSGQGSAIALADIGVGAGKLGGDAYHLPQLLAIVAQQQSYRGQLRQAAETYEQALTLIDQLLVNVPTFRDKNVLVGIMSPVYQGYFRFAIDRLHNPVKAFDILEQARGRGIADFLREVSAHGRETASRNGISDVNEMVRGVLKPIHAGLRFEQNPKKREELRWALWEQEKRSVLAGERSQWGWFATGAPCKLARISAITS